MGPGPELSESIPMPFLSYAQNAEDVVLARGFAGLNDGFYVDVGAGHPVYDSVTKRFYDQGWSGINVEPLPDECELLRRERPRDINLEMALSDEPGNLPLFAGPPENRGSSTLHREIAEGYRQRGEHFCEREVAVSTLDTVLDEHADRPIDLLKIDVEGHEAKVLAGFDLGRWRPRVLVIEATQPNSNVPSEHDWEPDVLATGYQLALFDGLNRIYVRDEDKDIVPSLSVPASVLDDFIPLRYHLEIEGAREAFIAAEAALQDAESYAHSKEEEVRGLGKELRSARDDLISVGDEVTRLQRVAESARRVSALEVSRSQDTLEELRVKQAELDAARQELVAVRGALEAVRSEWNAFRCTRTFRYTSFSRRLYGLIRGLRAAEVVKRAR